MSRLLVFKLTFVYDEAQGLVPVFCVRMHSFLYHLSKVPPFPSYMLWVPLLQVTANIGIYFVFFILFFDLCVCALAGAMPFG